MSDNSNFVYALQKGDKNLVKSMIEDDKKIVHTWDDFAIRWASRTGNLELVKFLVENGADIHAKNDQAVSWACLNGHLEVVKYLSEKGTNVQAGDNAAFRFACTNGHFEVVKFLFSNFWIDIHAMEDDALREAVRNGHFEIVKYLAQMGAHLHDKMVMRWAVIRGHTEIVKFLLDNKVMPFEREIENACVLGHIKIVRLLFNKTKNINIEDLFQQACENDRIEVIKFLVDKGATGRFLSWKQKLYLDFCEKQKIRAANRIGSWWIPICYRLKDENGEYRMAVKAWKNLSKDLVSNN